MSLPYRSLHGLDLLEITGPGGSLAFEADTGILRKFVHAASGVDLCAEIRANQLGQIGGVRVWDDLDKRWWDDFENPGAVTDVRISEGRLSFTKTYDGCPFRVVHELAVAGDTIAWNLRISHDSDVNRGLTVCYQVPMVAGWRYFAACLNGRLDQNGQVGHCEFDGNTLFNFMYHVGPYSGGSETTLPLFSMYQHESDTGLQFAAPGDAEIPCLWFEYANRGAYAWGSQRKDNPACYPHLDILHKFVGIHGRKACRVPLRIYFGPGDYRPLLGRFFEDHKDMFLPKCDKTWERVGTFQCGGLAMAEDDEARAFYKAVGGKYLELHGHFPYYGQYWNEGRWASVNEYEQRRLEALRAGVEADPDVYADHKVHSQKRMLDGIRKLQADGISVHIYFNFTDGDRYFHAPKIPDSINHDEEGNPWPSGWRFCHNIHAYPGSGAFDDFLDQATRLMEYYPADGFFFDCFRHYDFDFAHSDGITMVNNKPAGCVNFSMARLAKAIMDKAHALDKDSFANKPRTLLSMANVDGMLLEGDGARSEMYYYYTTLAKPNFYMWGRGVRSEEECLKRCVVLAAWPNTPCRITGQDAVELYSKYLPLYQHFTRRILCFEPEPLALDFGLEGELYTVGDDYLAGIMRPFASWDASPSSAGRKVGLTVSKADFVKEVLVHYAGEEVPRRLPVYRSGPRIIVPLPLLTSACVVRLVVGSERNDDQQPIEDVTDYFDSCGDPVSAYQMGSGKNE
ncbi:MAG: hypothetical protein J7M14_02510 [Planctomycetes bacterium]|nr:hypothetical protein [Planctomycetota bacterium]